MLALATKVWLHYSFIHELDCNSSNGCLYGKFFAKKKQIHFVIFHIPSNDFLWILSIILVSCHQRICNIVTKSTESLRKTLLLPTQSLKCTSSMHLHCDKLHVLIFSRMAVHCGSQPHDSDCWLTLKETEHQQTGVKLCIYNRIYQIPLFPIRPDIGNRLTCLCSWQLFRGIHSMNFTWESPSLHTWCMMQSRWFWIVLPFYKQHCLLLVYCIVIQKQIRKFSSNLAPAPARLQFLNPTRSPHNTVHQK